VRSQITAISGGTDFMVTLKSDGNMFTCGKNTHGQLGLGDLQPRDTFKCIEDLTSANIGKVFAGSRSCFAVVKSISSTHQFLKEFIAANIDQKVNAKMMKINTMDGN
jgi:alpha-tubulin suppressor-like RCC1 family protein